MRKIISHGITYIFNVNQELPLSPASNSAPWQKLNSIWGKHQTGKLNISRTSAKYHNNPPSIHNEYPLAYAHDLAALNHYRAYPEYYFELPEKHFAAYAAISSPALRALAIQPFISREDVLIQASALWLHTGYTHANMLRKVDVAATNRHQKKNTIRRIIPNNHLTRIADVKVTSLERTAIDLLLSDLELGICAIPKLIRCGTNIAKIHSFSENMHGKQGIGKVRSVLTQLREVRSLKQLENLSSTSLA
ncbi:hypothetical protein [Arcanobacterium hippocoleae]|uniref:hypothetical protein n=1 Tax=Arcanobacterium hippocoleae TaxID=149017 RepID=UPI003340E3F5